MALSSTQKQKVFDLLAVGKTATEVATEVGCSRSTVQRLKGDAKNKPLMQMARGIAATQNLSEQGSTVISTLNLLKEREPQMQEGLWLMFEGLSGLFQQVLSQTSPDDISPRQLPILAKSAADIAHAYADFSDRINGLTVLADEVQKINESRAA